MLHHYLLIILQPNFGQVAQITKLPEELVSVVSETLVRILEAKLEETGGKVFLF